MSELCNEPQTPSSSPGRNANSQERRPSVLWKYYTSDTFLRYVLDGPSLNLRWSAPVCFNDPFDCQMDFSPSRHSPAFKQNVMTRVLDAFKRSRAQDTESLQLIDYIKRKRQLPHKDEQRLSEIVDAVVQAQMHYWDRSRYFLRVFCLSEVNTNIPMWSHYANNHEGVCIGLDTLELERQWAPLNRHLHKVIYCDIPPDCTDFTDDVAMAFLGILSQAGPGNDVLNLLRTKSPHWAYEREWRFVTMIDQALDVLNEPDSERSSWSPPPRKQLVESLPVPVEILRSVTLGCRVSAEHEAEIRSTLDSAATRHVYIKKMRASSIKYELEIN